MRIWFDTEFLEDGKTIDLISIGMVREDGEEYYAVCRDADWRRIFYDEWLVANVIPSIPVKRVHDWRDGPGIDGLYDPVVRWRATIAAEIKTFVGDQPEFWAYCANYDWVGLCQLYGKLLDIPTGWPRYCLDIKQEWARKGKPSLPKQEVGAHNALEDARWNRRAWEFLEAYDA